MAFSEDQPRDEHGRWTSGGEDGAEVLTSSFDAGDAIRFAASGLENQADHLIAKAQIAGSELQNAAEEIAGRHGAVVTPINYKSKDSIIRKARDEYNGNITLIKDAVRNTIIAGADKIDGIVSDLEKHGGVIAVRRQKTDLGYTGNLIHYKTTNGLIGEIQVNTPEMIYAKEPEKFARPIIGNDKYDSIKNRYKTEGGKGHTYYEQYRVLNHQNSADLERKKQIEKESKAYYATFQ